MTNPTITAAAGVTVASEAKPCGGCGHYTKIRVHGEAFHWKCRPATPPSAPKKTLRFLEDLHDTYVPKRRTDGRMRAPWWQPMMPEITDLVQTSSWSFQLPQIPSAGRGAVLDRTAAFLSSAASVDVAHGSLVHTPDEVRFTGAPGFYKVLVCYWAEAGIPHPLGAAGHEIGAEVWVPHPRAQLLQRLADAGRYPEGFITDSYTSGRDPGGKPRSVRLDKWTDHVKAVRADAIGNHGRDSEQYEAVKTNFSQAVALMTGRWEPGKGRMFHPTVRVRRSDWGMAIQDMSACTLWGWYDDLRELAMLEGRPEWSPYALRNVDEILVPLDAVSFFTKTPRTGGRKPLPIDPAGLKLGTFKVKAVA